jgi:hypothetical protein
MTRTGKKDEKGEIAGLGISFTRTREWVRDTVFFRCMIKKTNCPGDYSSVTGTTISTSPEL